MKILRVLKPGERYLVTYRLQGWKRDRQMVATFLGSQSAEYGNGLYFSLRPKAGTQLLSLKDIRAVESSNLPVGNL